MLAAAGAVGNLTNDVDEPDRPPRGAHLVAAVIVLLVLVTTLIVYKWGSAYAAVRTAQASGTLVKPVARLANGDLFAATLLYGKTIWIALLFGILIAAAVRAFVSPSWFWAALGTRRTRQHIMGAVAGSPLMLCSCCVAPIFTSVYRRSSRLGPSLAFMLASPGLNVAAIALTFLLFPQSIAMARVALSLLAVLGLTALIGRTFGQPATGASARSMGFPHNTSDPAQISARALASRYLSSVLHVTVVTVPLIVAGVVLSNLILPAALNVGRLGGLFAVAAVSAIALPIALPTFFEIPLALMLLGSGAPSGAAVALLVAGPIINLPSLFVLGAETRPRVAVSLAVGIAAIAFVGGALLG
jgi:uncharacterized membrane protein YraQ (UPF0718 family)